MQDKVYSKNKARNPAELYLLFISIILAMLSVRFSFDPLTFSYVLAALKFIKIDLSAWNAALPTAAAFISFPLTLLSSFLLGYAALRMKRAICQAKLAVSLKLPKHVTSKTVSKHKRTQSCSSVSSHHLDTFAKRPLNNKHDKKGESVTVELHTCKEEDTTVLQP